MSNAATRASNWLASRMEAVAGQTVKYRRNGSDCSITAVSGVRTSEDYGTDGALVVSTNKDWIVDPLRLVIDGEQVRPQRGDLIITASETFVVVPDQAENCWRWTDQFHSRIRIHTIERHATGEDQ